MALTPLTEREKTLIVKNVLAAVENIDKLNGTGYNYLYLASGFIAHFNIHGFKDYYRDNDLRSDILENALYNRYGNFRPGDRDYDYYMAKADVYKRLVAALTDFDDSCF